MGKVERMGTGIEKMKKLMLEAKLKEPVFTSDSFFHVIFYRSPEYAMKQMVNKETGENAEKMRRKFYYPLKMILLSRRMK